MRSFARYISNDLQFFVRWNKPNGLFLYAFTFLNFFQLTQNKK